uniref:Uncharacterized protein n=1 Tax=virus sp. ctqEG8 TaxID=2827998 RepID=A0A8S5RFH0_9VIRU|nr:MAG TPA: hypothetical protein [virus sp. ctqEG8]
MHSHAPLGVQLVHAALGLRVVIDVVGAVDADVPSGSDSTLAQQVGGVSCNAILCARGQAVIDHNQILVQQQTELNATAVSIRCGSDVIDQLQFQQVRVHTRVHSNHGQVVEVVTEGFLRSIKEGVSRQTVLCGGSGSGRRTLVGGDVLDVAGHSVNSQSTINDRQQVFLVVLLLVVSNLTSNIAQRVSASQLTSEVLVFPSSHTTESHTGLLGGSDFNRCVVSLAVIVLGIASQGGVVGDGKHVVLVGQHSADFGGNAQNAGIDNRGVYGVCFLDVISENIRVEVETTKSASYSHCLIPLFNLDLEVFRQFSGFGFVQFGIFLFQLHPFLHGHLGKLLVGRSVAIRGLLHALHKLLANCGRNRFFLRIVSVDDGLCASHSIFIFHVGELVNEFRIAVRLNTAFRQSRFNLALAAVFHQCGVLRLDSGNVSRLLLCVGHLVLLQLVKFRNSVLIFASAHIFASAEVSQLNTFCLKCCVQLLFSHALGITKDCAKIKCHSSFPFHCLNVL